MLCIDKLGESIEIIPGFDGVEVASGSSAISENTGQQIIQMNCHTVHVHVNTVNINREN